MWAVHLWMALKTRKKTGVLCLPLFCWYQDFVKQHEGVLASRHNMCRMQVATILRVSTECDTLLKGLQFSFTLLHIEPGP